LRKRQSGKERWGPEKCREERKETESEDERIRGKKREGERR
jgi:hypothetical protein